MMKVINPATMTLFSRKRDRPAGADRLIVRTLCGGLGGLLINAAQRQGVEFLVCRFLFFEVLL
jgi:hypothetical protein